MVGESKIRNKLRVENAGSLKPIAYDRWRPDRQVEFGACGDVCVCLRIVLKALKKIIKIRNKLL